VYGLTHFARGACQRQQGRALSQCWASACLAQTTCIRVGLLAAVGASPETSALRTSPARYGVGPWCRCGCVRCRATVTVLEQLAVCSVARWSGKEGRLSASMQRRYRCNAERVCRKRCPRRCPSGTQALTQCNMCVLACCLGPHRRWQQAAKMRRRVHVAVAVLVGLAAAARQATAAACMQPRAVMYKGER
jgi:hypothetical protein